jgi:hypothetical protein
MGEPEEVDDHVVVPIVLHSVPAIDLADDGTVLRIAAHIDAQAPPGEVEIVAESHRMTVDVGGRGRATIPLTELAAPEAIADGDINMTLLFPAIPGTVSVGVTLATADTLVG